GRALGHGRDRRAQPCRDVEEPPRAALAPVQVEDAAEHASPCQSLEPWLERGEEPRVSEDPRGMLAGPPRVRPRDARRGLRRAVLVAGQAAVAGRSALELVPVDAEPLGPVAEDDELDVARQEIDDLRQRAEQDRAEHDVPERETKLPPECLDLVDA